MTKKAEFNAEEWSTVVEGPLFAGLRVLTASRGGTFRESVAMGKAYTAAREKQGESELVDELVSSPPAVDASRVQQGGDIATTTAERLREAVQLVEQKATPEEHESYKSFILSVAQAVAEAHKEGGVLGVGGKQVSEQEQAAIDDIGRTIGTSAS
jgi:hypothetical protein